MKVQNRTLFLPHNTYAFYRALVAATAISLKSFLGNKKTAGLLVSAINLSIIIVED